jgi:4-aminobutyrate aminotransferase
MLGIEFDTADHAEELQWACFTRGLLVLECGSSTVRLSPPLVVAEDEVATALGILAEALASVAREPIELRTEAEAAGALTGVEAAV